ncbi:MAG: maltotransferase domain-containing protein, partial [Bacteroidota bacterium]
MAGAKGQVRALVRNVYPTIEGGRYPIKRVVGEVVNVWADVFADGHDSVYASLQYRHESERTWREVDASAIGNDRWHAQFFVGQQGRYTYRFLGWTDYARYWQYGITKKADAGLDVRLELEEGLVFLEHLAKKSRGTDRKFVRQCQVAFQDPDQLEEAIRLAKSEKLAYLIHRFPYRPYIAYSDQQLEVYVDREKAAFSTWYEFFPRSAAPNGGHGTFQDCLAQLPRVAELGFDTLYFPPVHPIGRVNRKGKNNATTAGPDDVGSCWGIGAAEGGHTALHPDLGSLEDFKAVIREAANLGIEVAMDFALQAAPDHPWVTEHPDWFRQRPDGSIQYAENPPKKYQDIYPIYFESSDWRNMWEAFLQTALYWVKQGIRVFRVDNPHTKPFQFWEWLIREVKEQ